MGYHPNATKAFSYLQSIYGAVRSLKRFNPNVPVTVFSNANVTRQQLLAHNVDSLYLLNDVPISPTGREWWTRMKHLNHSPYDFTLQIDSDRTVCGDISPIFRYLREYDILQSSAGVLPSFDNGVIAYRKGDGFNRVMELWEHYQTRDGNKWYGSDQFTFAKAIHKMKNIISCGELPPEWHAKVMPILKKGKNEWLTNRFFISRVLTSEVKITTGSREHKCLILNGKNPNLRRVLVYDGKNNKDKIFYSRDECENYFMDLAQNDKEEDIALIAKNRCFHHEVMWNSTFEKPIPRGDYVEMVRLHKKDVV